jgi:CRISPR/Cas system CSM-associated protein Csm3 (group 7 of RAMP superfamily)
MQDQAEKPYDFVPLSEELIDDGPAREKVIGHHRLEERRLSGYLKFSIETLTPLQVASGMIELVKVKKGDSQKEELASTHASSRGRAVIPGTSIKGAIRAIAEAISPSCFTVREGRTRSKIPDDLTQCDPKEGEICPACRLFGTRSYQGLVWFHDIPVPPGSSVIARTPLLWKPGGRDKNRLAGLYLNEDGYVEGRKFYYHARPASGPDARVSVKRGTRITTRVNFENLSEPELGLLVAAMGCHPSKRFPIKLGGGKPVGLGSVRLEIIEMGIIRSDMLRSKGRLGGIREMTDTELNEMIGKWVSEAERKGLILAEAFEDLADIYDPGGLEYPAPSGVY